MRVFSNGFRQPRAVRPLGAAASLVVAAAGSLTAQDMRAQSAVASPPVTASAPSAAVATGQPATYDRAAHDAVIRQVRAGERSPQTAFQTLAGWLPGLPPGADRQRVLSDAVVMAGQAGLQRDMVPLVAKDGVTGLAAYALLPVILAGRSVGNQDIQGQAVQRLQQLQPAAWETRFRYVQWLIDLRAYDDARRAVEALQRDFGNDGTHRVPLLELQAALADQQGHGPQAMQLYRNLLQQQPDHAYARKRLETLALQARPAAANPGAPAGLARPTPPADMSTAQQGFWLRQRALAAELRWAVEQRSNATGPQRHASLDALLPRYDALQQAVDAAARQEQGPASRWMQLRAGVSADRLRLWLERGRHQAVITEYQRLEQEGVHLPVDGLATVASAYASLRDARSAVAVYERAAADAAPGQLPAEVQSEMVYAYMDAGRPARADALVERMWGQTPPTLRLAPAPGTPNDEYDSLRQLQADVLTFSDRLSRAERETRALAVRAPGSAGYQLAQAKVQQLRSRPGRALDLYRAALTDHPDDARLRAAYADALFGAGWQREGREQLEQLQQLYPGERMLDNLAEENRAYRAARLTMDAASGKDGGTLSNRDRRVETRLISPLLADAWRVYARHVYGHGTLDQSAANLSGVGLGVMYQQGPFDASAEVHRSYQGPRKTGVAAEASLRLTDALRLRAAFDTASLDMPWRAVAAGITGQRQELGLAYVHSESRRLDLHGNRIRFSDGNRRHEWGASWAERWISEPDWQFSTTLSTATGGNTLQNVPYYSPSRQTLVHLGTRLQWLTWKNAGRQFTQVLELGGGRYRQAGFGTRSTLDGRYLHEWRFAPQTSLYYGVGWGRSPYDGVQETRKGFFAGFSVPLP